ncbi:HAD family hydrolase [Ruminococcus albus]|uniref:HAD-superfamily hydrolase, subfamily IA, variant 3 n=1 Tax=Ruminococcus albus (strain ATCC 27210 / DSM 20455 / JCM 14654 / NCDO 2250 / 7) TaxID=697329 RepID=E6UJ10_RUMA7|nr:HAD family phosphatase [Ruminococcus albus]ADU22276.1 HAD-superfamily hydrolase, subfamily IA, variant 3 [Ruminococcus albus 7 = DSM 20455]
MYTLNNIDGIVFDMDGVIFDTESVCMKCWLTVGERYGLENVEYYVRLCTGRNEIETERIVTEAYGDKHDIKQLRAEVNTEVRNTLNKGVPLKPGAREVLEWLHESGVKVGLASSTRYDIIVSEMTEVGLLHCFDVIIGGDMIVKSKPEPDIYLAACKKLGIDPKNTLAVEDSRNGILSASAAGMIPILIPDLIEPDEVMLNKAYVKFDNLMQFKDKMLNTGI